jgi:hypothetical protein
VLRVLLTEQPSEGSIEALLKEELSRYLARLGIDSGFLPAALTLFWLNRALSAYRRQGEPAVPPLNARRIQLADLAEHRYTLFGPSSMPFIQAGAAYVTA